MSSARVALIASMLVGCGAPQANAARTGPALCADTPRTHVHYNFGRDVQEDPDCWRAGLPVVACDSPVHPEVIGLWGLAGGSFQARLLYDGCCVTFHDTDLLRMTPTTAMMAESLTFGRPANVGAANRTRTVWEGDTLFSDSHLGRVAVARHEVIEGSGRLVFIDADRREHQVVRFEPQEQCIDEDTRDVLCARLVVPGETPSADTCPP